MKLVYLNTICKLCGFFANLESHNLYISLIAALPQQLVR